MTLGLLLMRLLASVVPRGPVSVWQQLVTKGCRKGEVSCPTNHLNWWSLEFPSEGLGGMAQATRSGSTLDFAQ